MDVAMNDSNIDNHTYLPYDTDHDTVTFIANLRFFLVRIFYPCLLIWGTIGNLLCLRVLLSKKFNKNSTCQYLAILAVIDILFIFMRSSKHIYKLFRDTTIFNTSIWVCRILTFFSSALAHMASWILVIVSFDRYLIVTSLYRRQTSTAYRVLLSTIILITIVVSFNLYYFFILGVVMKFKRPNSFDPSILRLLSSVKLNQTDLSNNNTSKNYSSGGVSDYKVFNIFVCVPSPGYEHFFRTYIPVIDILFVAVLPFLLICGTNLGIIVFAMRTNRHIQLQRQRNHRRHQRLTIMLLSVTLAFIGLTCPSVIFICVNKIIYSGRKLNDQKVNASDNANSDSHDHVQLLLEVCEALWYTKHSMNFILYTLSGEDFRREFRKLIYPYRERQTCASRELLDTTQTNNTINRPINETQVPIFLDRVHKKRL